MSGLIKRAHAHRAAFASSVSITLAALSVVIASPLHAGSSGGSGTEYLIQATGTAPIGNFTTMGINSNAVISLGSSSLTLGSTTYTPAVSGPQLLGIRDNSPAVVAGSPITTNDRFVYSFHSTGNVIGGNGIIDLAARNGLASPSLAPAVNASNQLLVMGTSYPSVPAAGFGTLGYSAYYDLTPNTAPVPGIPGAFYDTTADVSAAIKPTPQIAWSGVKPAQAFSNPGSPSFSARPLSSGYGLAPSASSSGISPAFQKLPSSSLITTGVNPASTSLRSETLAIVTHTVAASPGTGLSQLTEADLRMLSAKGRLPNGANFNVTTAQAGSDLRNGAAAGLGLDPSFAGGERDRRFLGTLPADGAVMSFSTAANDGSSVTVSLGDETTPALGITSTSSGPSFAEGRLSVLHRFADKPNASSQRDSILASRMALGLLPNNEVLALGYVTTSTNPIRVLAVDFEDSHGLSEPGSSQSFVMPTAANVTTGAYQLWSEVNAVTVAGTLATSADANGARTGGVAIPVSADTSAKPVLNDVSDDGSGTGAVRKFLNNLIGSSNTGNFAAAPATTAATPFDQLMAAGILSPSQMTVTKTYDGDAQTSRALSSVDPDGAGPALSEQAVYAATVSNANSTFNQQTYRYADPATHNGNITGQRMFIFDALNQTSNADLRISLTPRTFTPGDLNGDGVRSLADAFDWGRAYADPAAFILADATGIDTGQQLLQQAPGLNVSAVITDLDPGDGVRRTATLIPLTDLNGDGNVTVVGASGDVSVPQPGSSASAYTAFTAALGSAGGLDRIDAVTRADVLYFIYGASIDTASVDSDPITPGIQSGSAAFQREVGVRTGQLSINAAATAVNAGIDTVVSLTPQQKDDLKVEIRDVDGSGSRAYGSATAPEYNFLADALFLDSFSGLSYANITHVLSTPQDLTRLAIGTSSPGVIDTTIDQNDMDAMNQALAPTAGINPTGRLDHTWAPATTKSGSLDIIIAASSGTITVPTGATFTLSAGSLTVSGALDPFSDTSTNQSLALVNNASLTIGSSVDLASHTGLGALTLTPNGSLSLAPATAGADVFSASSLTLSPGSSLNLADNDLLLDYTGSSPLAELLAAQLAGQIIATSDIAGIPTLLVLLEASDIGLTEYAGLSIDATTVIGKFTYTGDANLDGQVDAFDYAAVDDNFGQPGSFLSGDLNGDGFVDAFDYSAVDDTFGAGVNNPLRPGLLANSTEVFIPEPTSLGLLALSGCLLISRRR